MNKRIIKIGKRIGIVCIILLAAKKIRGYVVKYKSEAEKYFSLFLMLDQWFGFKQEGKQTEKFFADRNIKKIAIYGMAQMGETLYKELADTEIEVLYAIDKNAGELYVHCCDVLKPTDDLPAVDAVIVTPFAYFKQIKSELKRKISCPVFSIEDVIYGMSE
ncbi:hypothetical protein FMM75_16130 [Lachnospiraceae bacterium MD335]|nr:hypothetical protein [Lachnospiraceae bacterium MD335]